MSIDFDRRRFLKESCTLGAAGFVSAGFPALSSFATDNELGIAGLMAEQPPAFTSFMDVYRRQWDYDKVVKGTHLLNCFYQGACSFDVYVKDGVVIREEQAASYDQTHSGVPDHNPRGCQKGSCFSNRMYDSARLKYPLKRVGERGEGKWQRVSWDEAMDDIADTYLDVTLDEGTDRTIVDFGPGADMSAGTAGLMRFSKVTQAPCLECNSEIGDANRGVAETTGKMSFSRSGDDYFNTEIILFWAGNPAYTQIPNFHYWTEARYNGAKIISICPDYNPSAMKADQWIPVKPGCDAAFGLGACHVVIDEDLIDHEFVREQTDFPVLVRGDTEGFLLLSDLTGIERAPGEKEQFVCFDRASNDVAALPWRSLALEGIDPQLDVSGHSVTLANGEQVEVRSVFSLLKERLQAYAPEKTSELCGIHPDVIRQFARDIAKAKSVSNISTTALTKYYHGNLMERSQLLLFSLAGHMGKKGSGYCSFALFTSDGLEPFGILDSMEDLPAFGQHMQGMVEQRMAAGDTMEMIVRDVAHSGYFPKPGAGAGWPLWTSGAMFWYVHGKVIDLSDEEADPFIKRSYEDHISEAVDKKWQPLIPAAGRTPRIMIHSVSNPLRRIRGSQKVLENLWPQLKLSICLDWRMSTTAMHADYVLPVAAYYEITNCKWGTTTIPFQTVTQKAVEPLGETKSDWNIFGLLTKHIQKRARARGISVVTSPLGEKVDLSTVYDRFTMNGAFSEEDTGKVARTVYELSTNLKNDSWDEIQEKGVTRFSSLGMGQLNITAAADIKPNETLSPLEWHTRDKMPYATRTRRLQFYIDHPLYHELDEVLPRHKDPIMSGGKYPLHMTGGHNRWSIHSAMRDQALLLRLQRGEATIILSIADAADRGISDGDLVRAWNDNGHFELMAKISAGCRPGQTIMYHAWEDNQFRGENSNRHVTGAPLNPTGLAGDESHFKVTFGSFQPEFTDRETRVEIERIAGREDAA